MSYASYTTARPVYSYHPLGQAQALDQLKAACAQLPNMRWDTEQGKCVGNEIPKWLPYVLGGFAVLFIGGMALDAWRISKGLASPGTSPIYIGGTHGR